MKIKAFFFFFFFFFVIFSCYKFSQAQSTHFWVEQQNYATTTKISPLLCTWAYHQGKSGFGMWNFSLVSPGWAESIVGGSYGRTFKTLYAEVGVGAGFETNAHPYRSSAYLFLINKPDTTSIRHQITALANYEIGGSGYWYLFYIKYNLSKHVAVGAHAQYGATIGPRMDLMFCKDLLFWMVPGYNLQAEEVAVTFGLRANF